jgi:hypothetical protein
LVSVWQTFENTLGHLVPRSFTVRGERRHVRTTVVDSFDAWVGGKKKEGGCGGGGVGGRPLDLDRPSFLI